MSLVFEEEWEKINPKEDSHAKEEVEKYEEEEDEEDDFGESEEE